MKSVSALKKLQKKIHKLSLRTKKLKKYIHKKRIFLLTTASGIFVLGGIVAIFFFIATHITFSANFADDILRPTIGNTATIEIEAVFFNFQDTLNHIKYAFIQPTIPVFTKTTKIAVATSSATTFSLSPIATSSAFTPLPGEGIWTPITVGSSEAVMAKTFLRTDPQRDYANVTLVKINMQKLHLGIVAGTAQPGGPTKPGPGKVPPPIQTTGELLAAFNGGFQQKDGFYGMIVGNTTYLPLKTNLATLIMYQNQPPQIINYIGQTLGKGIVAVRQNGPLILQNNKIVTSLSDWDMQTWGLTTTNTMYTWRSGIGVTKNGDIIYGVGPSLVPETLAAALKAAGAVNAMQLDINPVWVRFVIFTPTAPGQYNYYSLLQDMVNGGWNYLYGYQKDFFYVYKGNS